MTTPSLAPTRPWSLRRHRFLFALLGLLATAFSVQAHPGHSSPYGFLSGLTHPLGGLDHLIAMIAVGLWAAQLGGSARWLVPSVFVVLMTLGGALGLNGFSLPVVEAGILASVVVLGLFVAAAARWSMPVILVCIGCFALLHGNAHGLEMPGAGSGLSYVLGFTLISLALQGGGLLAGLVAQRVAPPLVLRFAGAAVTCVGAYVWLA